MEYKDYYSILGVPRTATAEEIKKAFRKLARQYHPDVAKDKKRAEERFKDINEAYEVLGNPENRKKYDALGSNWKEGGFRPHRQTQGQSQGNSRSFVFEGTGFSEFFERFFGQSNQWGDFQSFADAQSDDEVFNANNSAHRGNDLQGDVLVTLDELMQGSIRTVTVQSNPESGKTESFKVRIPPGVQEGQWIRVAGKGEAGGRGGTSGDLLLRVRIASHPDFQVRRYDLVYELELAPWEAVLGATVEIPAPGGSNLTIRVPPGTVHGQQLRLKGQGLPSRKRGERGDLFASITIQTPKQVSAEERQLWEKLSRISSFNPRI